MSDAAHRRHTSPAPPLQVVTALRAALKTRGLVEYAVVDHGHDMRQVGAPGFEAWTLIFGSPAAGARLLARDLEAAVDIPLRLAVIAAPSGGSTIVARDMRTLLPASLGEVADGFNHVLDELAAEALR